MFSEHKALEESARKNHHGADLDDSTDAPMVLKELKEELSPLH